MSKRLAHKKQLATLALCLLLAACSNAEDVYTGLTLRDANEMVAILRQKGVDAQRVLEGTGGTFKITVPKEKFSESVLMLTQNGYPRETFKSMAEMFPGEGLVVSPMEQRARYAYAISQELSRTISGIDGVVKARVHVVLNDPEARVGQPSKASASVSVHFRPSIDPGELGPKIRLIVSNAVQGLNYNDVSISFFTLGGIDSMPTTPQPDASSVPAPVAGKVPAAMPGEVSPRRIIEEPKAEVAAPVESSGMSWSGILQYFAALLAILGGVFYIRRAMRSNSDE